MLDPERHAAPGSALPQPLKKHIQVPHRKINEHWSEQEPLGQWTTVSLPHGEILITYSRFPLSSTEIQRKRCRRSMADVWIRDRVVFIHVQMKAVKYSPWEKQIKTAESQQQTHSQRKGPNKHTVPGLISKTNRGVYLCLSEMVIVNLSGSDVTMAPRG